MRIDVGGDRLSSEAGESGEIGRRAGFRFLFPIWVYGFDSLLSHFGPGVNSGLFCSVGASRVAERGVNRRRIGRVPSREPWGIRFPAPVQRSLRDGARNKGCWLQRCAQGLGVRSAALC